MKTGKFSMYMLPALAIALFLFAGLPADVTAGRAGGLGQLGPCQYTKVEWSVFVGLIQAIERPTPGGCSDNSSCTVLRTLPSKPLVQASNPACFVHVNIAMPVPLEFFDPAKISEFCCISPWSFPWGGIQAEPVGPAEPLFSYEGNCDPSLTHATEMKIVAADRLLHGNQKHSGFFTVIIQPARRGADGPPPVTE